MQCDNYDIRVLEKGEYIVVKIFHMFFFFFI